MIGGQVQKFLFYHDHQNTGALQTPVFSFHFAFATYFSG
jgi:hypothetical protein